MSDTATETAPSGGGGLAKAERWIGNHKVLAIGGAGVGAFLILSRKGSGSVTESPAVAATDESSVNTDTSGVGGGEGDETLPPDDTTPPPDTTDTTPPADTTPPPAPQAPISLGPSTPPPSLASQVAATPPATTISTVRAQTSPAAQPTVTYTNVPGYYTELQIVRPSGATETWHHYTSGTQAGRLVKVSDQGTAWGWPWKSAPSGWQKGNLGYVDTAYYRVVSNVQYEVTRQASTNTP